MSDIPSKSPPAACKRSFNAETIGLAFLFGVMYFIQGISEPTEGLIAQPVRKLLDTWGQSTSTIGLFGFLLALPWSIKPIYGMITDFVPLGGTRHRGYLLLTSGIAAAALFLLYMMPLQQGMSIYFFLAILLLPTVAVAFSDVVVDALMVEKGQPRGITGQLQSVQWACMYAAMIVVGQVGGQLAKKGRPDIGFLIGSILSAISFFVTLIFVRETKRDTALDHRPNLLEAMRKLLQTLRTPAVLISGAFLFLWNFNPFTGTVLQFYMTKAMNFGDEFYGQTLTLQAIASIAASIAYGFYCRRIAFSKLIHLSIVSGIIATVAYWGMYDKTSAYLISLAVGFTYMTATMIQLDLAARVCTPATAGTTFAALMALSNLSLSASQAVGSGLYEYVAERRDFTTAFNIVVGVGAVVTACCWIFVPALNRLLARHEIA